MRHIVRAVAVGASLAATGWAAGLLQGRMTGAWAALTLFPGWFLYTIVTKHPTSEPLGVAGGVAVGVVSCVFWALAWLGAVAFLARARRPANPPSSR